MKKIILIFVCIFGILQANNIRKDIDVFSKENDFKYVQDNLDKYKKQCEGRDGVSCRIVSEYYSKLLKNDGSQQDKELEQMEFDWAMKGCNLKDGDSCYSVAISYKNVSGFISHLPKDKAKTLEFLKKGCDYKHSDSCVTLGHRYSDLAMEANNKPEKKEYERKAKFFYKKGCDLGNLVGCGR